MSKKREHHKLFMVGSDAPFQFTEAYKSLRTNLEFLAATSDCKTILITSSVPGEGKSNVAVNLAITLADSGKRVVLVDCDMRKIASARGGAEDAGAHTAGTQGAGQHRKPHRAGMAGIPQAGDRRQRCRRNK